MAAIPNEAALPIRIEIESAETLGHRNASERFPAIGLRVSIGHRRFVIHKDFRQAIGKGRFDCGRCFIEQSAFDA